LAVVGREGLGTQLCLTVLAAQIEVVDHVDLQGRRGRGIVFRVRTAEITQITERVIVSAANLRD